VSWVNSGGKIGRDREVGLLEERWEQAAEGMGQIVLLIGEAGLGKSRLVHVMKEHVTQQSTEDGDPIIEWRTTPHHQNSSFYPPTECFERILGLGGHSPGQKLDKLAAHLEELNLDGDEEIGLLASLLSVPLDGRYPPLKLNPQLQKEKTFDLLVDWLKECSYRQPVLFIVEDLHWVDPTTLEFLELLVDQGFSDSILTLLTFRPEFETPWKSKAHQTQVALNRLTKRQLGEMMVLKSGIKKIPQNVIDLVVERTDGVPLFVEEFTTMVLEQGSIREVDGEMHMSESFPVHEIPATLQDLLMARLDRMASDIEVVQLGAAVGREFSHELIQAVSPLQERELQSELEKLVEAELLFQRGRGHRSRYIFKHALIQDAAYQSLLKKKRQQFHQQIAEVLEKQFPDTASNQPELLAHHFTEASLAQQAVEYWGRAGTRALGRCAHIEAIGHLNRGIDDYDAGDRTPAMKKLPVEEWAQAVEK
jgi:predicted ATPase